MTGVERFKNCKFQRKPSDKHLKKLGFYFDGSLEDADYYQYNFIVEYCNSIKKKKRPSLICEIKYISSENFVQIDVKTADLIKPSFYPDFYSDEYGNPEPRLSNVCTEIQKKLDELGIVQVEEKKQCGKKVHYGKRKRQGRYGKRLKENRCSVGEETKN